MISDNGKVFKAATKTIQAILGHKDIKRYFSGLGMKWVFKAPWWGGIFVRMVRPTKRFLRKIAEQAKLSYDELLTTLTEVEMVLNSQPLTHVSADDFEEPLTPSHLLIGQRVMSLPNPVPSDDSDEEMTANLLSRRSKHLNFTLNRYLLELREAHHLNRGSNATAVEIGDIVVVHNDNQPRGFWKLAQVERTITGQDGKVRGAAVRVTNCQGQPTMLHHLIQCLCPLEISLQEKAELLPNLPEANSDDDSGDLDGVAVQRSK